MKKIIIMFLSLIIILSGCNEDSNINEMKDCNSDICGYWKLYGIEIYENNELIDVTDSLGYEKLKITKDIYEIVNYKENSMYDYQKSSYEYSDNKLKVDNITYTTEIDNGDLLLSYIDDDGYKEILYYQKIEESAYPRINTNEGKTVVYKSDAEIECTNEQCGHWKLQNVIENCGNGDYELSEEKIISARYLKFLENKMDRIFESSDTKFKIDSKNYLVVTDDAVENYYTLYTSEYTIDSNQLENSNVITETIEIKDNNLIFSKLVMYLEEEKLCTNKYNYIKINESEFPNINIYME